MSDKYEGSYKCNYPGCGMEFKFLFQKHESGGKRQNGTSVVYCPKGHKLRPILDAIKIIKIKEGLK